MRGKLNLICKANKIRQVTCFRQDLTSVFNTFTLRQNDSQYAYDIFKFIVVFCFKFH